MTRASWRVECLGKPSAKGNLHPHHHPDSRPNISTITLILALNYLTTTSPSLSLLALTLPLCQRA